MQDQSNTTDEIWRVIPEFPTYVASSLGRVKKAILVKGSTGRPRKPMLNPVSGYYEVLFCENYKKTMRRLHRVIVQTFIGPIPPRMEVNHKNGDRADNRVENLEIVTSSENKFHAYRELNRKHSFKTALAEDQVIAVRQMLADGYQSANIAIKFGVAIKTIRDIKSGRTWKYVQ